MLLSADSSRSICGSRRVAYLLIGLFLQGGGWLFLGLVGDAAMLPTIAAQQFAVTMGQVCVGVICDALIVESVACERGAQVGKLQTTCQLTFAFGGLVGTVLSGVLPQFLGASSQTIFVSSLVVPNPKNMGCSGVRLCWLICTCT